MSLEVEERAKRIRDSLDRPDVQEAMAARCAEQGHEYENCCSAVFQIYQSCKWCGWIRMRGSGSKP